MSAADRGAIIVSLICLMGCILFSPTLRSTEIRIDFFVGEVFFVIIAWAVRERA